MKRSERFCSRQPLPVEPSEAKTTGTKGLPKKKVKVPLVINDDKMLQALGLSSILNCLLSCRFISRIYICFYCDILTDDELVRSNFSKQDWTNSTLYSILCDITS